jgi:hypothetical protein
MTKEPLKILQDTLFEKKFPLDDKYIDSVPDVVYHYSNITAFINILQNKCLWASRAEFLNDATEFRFGQQICRREMDRLASTNSDYIEFIRKLQSAIDFEVNSPFVTCFCKDGDLLSQWRGYSSHGQGISVGFETGVLRRINSARLNKVVYEPRDQADFIFEQIKALADSFLTVGIDLDNADNFRALIGYTGAIERYCVLMKDAAFREENELRLNVADYYVETNGLPVKFRVRNNLVVPYLELDLADNWPALIREIIIGPGPDPELRYKNIMHFLNMLGLNKVSVNLSKCQYRL